MNPQQVAQIIEAGLAGSRALVKSDDNVHFEAVVIAAAFEGCRSVQRHQLVYGTLGKAVGNEIHTGRICRPGTWINYRFKAA